LEIHSLIEENEQTKEDCFSSVDFWKDRWGTEKEEYVPGPLYMYKANLRALKTIIKRNDIDLTHKYILDACCGKGFYSSFYRKYYSPSLLSIDVSDWVTERMRQKGFYSWSISLLEDDVFFTDSVGTEFDWVHCTQALVHMIEQEHFERACINLYNSISPTGYLLVGDRFLPDPEKAGKKHIKLRYVGDYTKIFEELGLQYIDIEKSFPIGGALLLFKKDKGKNVYW
jgi:hypothetical protein